MPDSAVRYTITADPEPAIKAAGKVSDAFGGIGTAAQTAFSRAQNSFSGLTSVIASGARALDGVFRATGDAAGSLTHAIVKAGEAAGAGVVVFKSLSSILGGYSAAAGAAGSSIDALTNSVRAARIGYAALTTGITSASTLIAASTVGIGLAAEETLKLSYATGKLVEQRALVAARSTFDLRTINEFSVASHLANANYLELLDTLNTSAGTARGQSALAGLGITGISKSETIDPNLLGRIGVAFEKIKDPVERARIGIALFGDEFDNVQGKLNSDIYDTVQKVREFGAALGPEQSKNIDLAKRNLDSLGRVFEGTFDGARLNVQRLKNELADLGASVVNAFAPDENRGKALLNLRLRGVTPYIGSSLYSPLHDEINRLDMSDAFAPLAQQALQSGVEAAETYSRNTAALGKNLANPIIESLKNSREGIEAELGSYKTQRDEAIKALHADDLGIRQIRTGKNDELRTLTNKERFTLQQQVASASQGVEYDNARIDAIDRAKETAKAQQEAVRSSAETLLSAQSKDFGPLGQAFLEAQRESLRDSSRVDKDGNLQRFPLTPETANNIQKTLAANLLEVQKKQLAEQQKGVEETFHLSVEYDSQLLQKRLENDNQLLQKQIENGVRLKEFDVDQAGFDRDSQLRALDTIDAQTLAQKKNLESRKADIEVAYQKQVLQTRLELADDAAERELADEQRRLENLGLSRQEIGTRLAPLIDQQNQFRNSLGLTSQAAIAAARDNANNRIDQITREGNLNEFNSIKSSATSLIDTLFTRTRDFGKAVGDFFRHAVLAPLEEIAASQVAKLIFGAINPGQSVSFASGGGGTAKFGRFGGILGSLGLGTQPVFSSPGSSVIAAPPPAGDVSFGTGAAGISLPGFPAANLAASLPGLLALNFGGYTPRSVSITVRHSSE